MAKPKNVFVCCSCGYQTPKWNGCCPNCGEWNTLEEKVITVAPRASSVNAVVNHAPESVRSIEADHECRYRTGMAEVDTLLGGGIVKGALILLGGDPGIGKSTLLLQICRKMAEQYRILYVSGEESTKQLKLRAQRLNVDANGLYLFSETDMDVISQTILAEKPDLVMIDSIQTMSLKEISSAAGSVTQVRECTTVLQRIAKIEDIPILVVGHVNKDGNLAGPKVLEHIVDAVLYFEGETQFAFRILRAVKNRFGSTNEIAVFEMEQNGLQPVENTSAMLLRERPQGVSGTCVCSVMEGTRPILAEVQALAARSSFGTPRRMSTGFDYNRMSLILAVLEKRAGYMFGALDCYINVVGGLRLDEPAADLAIALALVSSLRDVPLEDELLAFGELGLAGELRSVPNAAKRVVEAKRLGFKKVVLPQRCMDTVENVEGMECIPVGNIKQALAIVLAK